MAPRTLFRPCIDLHSGKVKQIVGGTLSDDNKDLKTNFESEKDAAYYASLYKKDNIEGGHVIMLGPGNEEAAMGALAAYPQGLQVGGGITAANAKKYLDAGASHVIVTSSIFADGELDFWKLHALVDAAGKARLVIDLSCRARDDSWFVATNRWQTITSYEINQENLQRLEKYCSEFLIHAADVEGLQKGIDEALVTRIAEYVSIPVTYAGGARNLSDLELVQRLSKGKVHLTIGSALDIFGGSGVTYEECVKYNQDMIQAMKDDPEQEVKETERDGAASGAPDHQAIYGEYAEYLQGQRANGWKD